MSTCIHHLYNKCKAWKNNLSDCLVWDQQIFLLWQVTFPADLFNRQRLPKKKWRTAPPKSVETVLENLLIQLRYLSLRKLVLDKIDSQDLLSNNVSNDFLFSELNFSLRHLLTRKQIIYSWQEETKAGNEIFNSGAEDEPKNMCWSRTPRPWPGEQVTSATQWLGKKIKNIDSPEQL